MHQRYPYAWVFLVPFTIISAFAVLNLFIGVIVEAVQRAPLSSASEIKKTCRRSRRKSTRSSTTFPEAATQQRMLDGVRALRAEVAALRGAPPPA